MFAQALATAKRTFLKARFAQEEAVLASANEAEDAVQVLRSRLVDAAVEFEVAGSTLARRCAIGIAQTKTQEEINAMYFELPREGWCMVAAARSRLEELENAESISMQSMFAKF